MKNKISPYQFDPFEMRTPSGNLNFIQGDTFFNVYLNPTISGDFDVEGTLKVNGGNVVYTDETNNVAATNTVISSLNAFATGSNNTILGSNNSEISGSNNLILGGSDNQVASSDFGNIFGRNCVLSHTGAMLLGDGDVSRQKFSQEHQSLTIDFASGTFINNDLRVGGNAYLTGDGGVYISNGDFYVDVNSSGLFSGDAQILGNFYKTGSPFQNLQNLLDASGSLVSFTTQSSGALTAQLTGVSGVLATTIFNTGASLSSRLISMSGEIVSNTNSQLNNTIKTTGVQTANGIKTFNDQVRFLSPISGRNALFSGDFVLRQVGSVPSARNSLGVSGQISHDTRYLYVCTGFSAWARILITGW
jgi:hypothetical protein